MATANMNLTLPSIGNTLAPDWAEQLNNDLQLIDQHNHTAGNGVPITPSAINIDQDLPFNHFNAILLRSVRLDAQSSPLAEGDDLDCLYTSGVDLYYNDGNGNQVRITQSGGVAGSPGSIANLTSPASATYVAADATFVWESDAGIAANMDAGSLLLRNITPNSTFAVTINPPAALGSNYDINLPTLPASQKIVTLDNSGNLAAVYGIDNTTIEISANNIQVKDLGISTAKIADLAVITAKINDAAITPAKMAAVAFVEANLANTARTSTSFTSVATLTLTLSGLRPVEISLLPQAAGTSTSRMLVEWLGAAGIQLTGFSWRILRGASTLCSINFQGLASTVSDITSPLGVLYIDTAPVAGSTTYTLQVASSTTDTRTTPTNIRTWAREI